MAFQAVMFAGPHDGLRRPVDRPVVAFDEPGGISTYVDTRRFDRQGCRVYEFVSFVVFDQIPGPATEHEV